MKTLARMVVLGGLVTLMPVLPMTDARAALSSRFAHCSASRPRSSAIGFPEVRGVATGGTLWALLFYKVPARAGDIEKIAIRMTGRGLIHIVAIGPSGLAIQPTWGPEMHGGSNWNRPGDEWGTGWTFPSPGCWHLHAKRPSHIFGNVWLQVSASTIRG